MSERGQALELRMDVVRALFADTLGELQKEEFSGPSLTCSEVLRNTRGEKYWQALSCDVPCVW